MSTSVLVEGKRRVFSINRGFWVLFACFLSYSDPFPFDDTFLRILRNVETKALRQKKKRVQKVVTP